MTSTPVSLNDESLNGSWSDINSASQMYSPRDDDDPPEFLRAPYSDQLTDSDLSMMSFQVERFLQEAQRTSSNNTSIGQPPLDDQQMQRQSQQLQQQQQQQQLEWIWDWTAQPEYFSGQEWKACESKAHERGDFMSLLLMTNILSIVIGAGITAALMRRSNT